MSFAEGIIGLIASVCAIIGTMVIVARYLGKKFDHWVDTQVENTKAVKHLSFRLVRVERALKLDKDDV